MRIKRRLTKLLCLVLVVVTLTPTYQAYAFSWDDVKNAVHSVVKGYDENSKKIKRFLQEINTDNQEKYYDFLSQSENLVKEEFERIIEECKKQKEIFEGACYGVDEFEWLTWGMDMVKAKDAAEERPSQPVKVALIDSGVNYSSDIEVVERVNFIPGHEEISIMYEDVSGHGTNIAGIIAAKENEVGITGVNPNVELYSAKVLDAGNCAPISRVVEGIEWAIEKDVNIINISFTTDTNSKELYEVIKKAYDQGILIIAAAGNDGYVAYPAAYPEVIAVGSVNSEGEVSTFSPRGKNVELVAPGELITATDVFESLSTNSGTSYAAPYVTAIASLLWEKDLSCSSNFIRCVLDCSANLYGVAENYGYGLVDYQFAEAIYEVLKPIAKGCEAYGALMRYAVQICEIYNPTSVPTVSAPDDLVEGVWYKDANGAYAHRVPLLGLDLAGNNGSNPNWDAKALVLAGCMIADVKTTGLRNMYVNPYFHGYMYYYPSGNDNGSHWEANYIAGGLYLTYVAKAMLSGREYTTSSIYVKTGDENNKYDLAGMITSKYIDSVEKITWEEVESQIEYYGGSDSYKAIFDPNSSIDKALVIYGLAIHSFMDIFAHSAVNPADGTLIYHSKDMGKNADNVNMISERYDAASKVAQNTLRLISRMSDSETESNASFSSYAKANISVFNISGGEYEDYFKLANFSKYAKQVCEKSGLFKSTNAWTDFYEAISTDTWK